MTIQLMKIVDIHELCFAIYIYLIMKFIINLAFVVQLLVIIEQFVAYTLYIFISHLIKETVNFTQCMFNSLTETSPLKVEPYFLEINLFLFCRVIFSCL